MTIPRTQRFTASIASFGAVVLDAIEASRAIHTASTPRARREVLDRFAAELERDTDRAAA